MPRKYQSSRHKANIYLRGFNEAGADAPEIPYRPTVPVYIRRDASMRPGRMPRKYPRRPMVLAPLDLGFNEAGADAPEIPAE